MNHVTLVLVCLSIATLLTWFSFSVWENEFEAPKPLESSTDIIRETKREAEMNIWMKKMEEKYSEERRKIEVVCQKYGTSLKRGRTTYANNFIMDPFHKLAYCRHGKVGTSTWMEYFLNISNLLENLKSFLSGKDKALHNVIPRLYSPMKSTDFTTPFVELLKEENYLTFSFVRHPFERLVSAYEDKFKDQNDASYYARIAEIQFKFGGEVSFQNFVDHVLDSKEVKKCRLERCSEIDAHWRPFYDRCAYCDVNYDVIGRMETFEEDVRFILIKQNLMHLLDEHGSVFHLHHSNIDNSSSFDSFQHDRAMKYFSDLTPDTVEKLFNLYKVDFEMFGYSAEQYLQKQTSESSPVNPNRTTNESTNKPLV